MTLYELNINKTALNTAIRVLQAIYRNLQRNRFQYKRLITELWRLFKGKPYIQGRVLEYLFCLFEYQAENRMALFFRRNVLLGI